MLRKTPNRKSFEYPITVLAFNRPEYLEKLLSSLKKQTLKVKEENVFFFLDGFEGSKDQFLGRENFSPVTLDVCNEYFPTSKKFVNDLNYGIAGQYRKAEELLFGKNKSSHVLFLEEDLELHQEYLSFTEKLVSKISENRLVATVSAFGDIGIEKNFGKNTYYPQRHLWGHVVSRDYWESTRKYLSIYYSLMNDVPYFKRDDLTIRTVLAKHGIQTLHTSQDAVKDAIRRHKRMLSITTGYQLGRNIGVLGQHFTEENFILLGLQNVKFEEGRILHPGKLRKETIKRLIIEDDITQAQNFGSWFESTAR